MGNESELYPTNFNKQMYSEIEQQIPTQNNMPQDMSQYQQPQYQEQQQPPAIERHMIKNPFAMEQYQNVGLPDTPLQFGGGMTEAILGDKDVPEMIKKNFWQVFLKDNILTFLDDQRKENLMLNFSITKIDTLNSIPFYDYTFDAELKWNIIRNVYETKLNRSLGFKGNNIKNERILLQSQFTEQRNINEMNQQGGAREGFFKRLLGRK